MRLTAHGRNRLIYLRVSEYAFLRQPAFCQVVECDRRLWLVGGVGSLSPVILRTPTNTRIRLTIPVEIAEKVQPIGFFNPHAAYVYDYPALSLMESGWWKFPRRQTTLDNINQLDPRLYTPSQIERLP